MKIEVLKRERISEFIAYCKKHRKDIDDSFLYDEDLKKFEPTAENPTFIVSNERGEMIGAASLMTDDYFRRGGKARFRIFHSELQNMACYQMLLQSLVRHVRGFEKFFIFVPTTNKTLMEQIGGLNFTVERYSYLMIRERSKVPEFNLPKDYVIRSFRPGKDEEIWCEVRNAGFASLKGSETPITPEIVAEMNNSEMYIEGGMKILFHKEKPVGIVRGEVDEYEGEPIMSIGALTIIPEYQHRGLGRMLLRSSLNFAEEKSFKRTILSVNGENEKAKTLYSQEGFKQVESVICYEYNLSES